MQALGEIEMTTIVYKHKDREIAYESLVTCGSTVVESNYNKCLKINGKKYFAAGGESDIGTLIDIERTGLTECEFDCNGMMMTYDVKRDCMMLITVNDDGKVIRDLYTCDWAIGSGREFALGAMDFGANAREAVKVAIGRDLYSGGRIRSVKFK